MRFPIPVVCLLAFAAPARAEEVETIGGRSEFEWRRDMAGLEQSLALAQGRLAECEEREAPPAYDDVDAIVKHDERGALRVVGIRRCDDERLEAAEFEKAVEIYEEQARRRGVPPGWLR